METKPVDTTPANEAVMVAHEAGIQFAVIETADAYVAAGDELVRIKTLEKRINEYHEPMRRANAEAGRLIRQARDEMLAPLVAAESLIKKAIADWKAKERQLVASSAEAGAIMPVAKHESISTRTYWRWKLVDPNLVPRKFWKRILDEDKIAVEVKTGARIIPGLDIFPEEVIVGRT